VKLLLIFDLLISDLGYSLPVGVSTYRNNCLSRASVSMIFAWVSPRTYLPGEDPGGKEIALLTTPSIFLSGSLQDITAK
jgi:hypothetical protein